MEPKDLLGKPFLVMVDFLRSQLDGEEMASSSLGAEAVNRGLIRGSDPWRLKDLDLHFRHCRMLMSPAQRLSVVSGLGVAPEHSGSSRV